MDIYDPRPNETPQQRHERLAAEYDEAIKAKRKAYERTPERKAKVKAAVKKWRERNRHKP